MSGHSPVDPGGLREYSVVFTDRSLNHMSETFQEVMRDISATLKSTYDAAAVAVVPGGGTYGMEAIVRQFAANQKSLIIRNGYFSYRWSQILEMAQLPGGSIVLKARMVGDVEPRPWAPPPLAEVLQVIREQKPGLVFAPHVETSSGIILPHAYLRAIGQAVHEYGGLFVLDCVASGTVWVQLTECGVDVLLTAPQKGWSASPCAALVMLSPAALERMKETKSSSFACDLNRWLQIMQAYENGGHAYHATLPTDALVRFRNAMRETIACGLTEVENAQWDLGSRVRTLLAVHGFASVAARGFEAPGVVVCYTSDPLIQNGKRFAECGLQTAAGVPLMCDEPADFRTFRIGLFGLDKLRDVDNAVDHLEEALQAVAPIVMVTR